MCKCADQSHNNVSGIRAVINLNKSYVEPIRHCTKRSPANQIAVKIATWFHFIVEGTITKHTLKHELATLHSAPIAKQKYFVQARQIEHPNPNVHATLQQFMCTGTLTSCGLTRLNHSVKVHVQMCRPITQQCQRHSCRNQSVQQLCRINQALCETFSGKQNRCKNSNLISRHRCRCNHKAHTETWISNTTFCTYRKTEIYLQARQIEDPKTNGHATL
jgi:hypothetical protein